MSGPHSHDAMSKSRTRRRHNDERRHDSAKSARNRNYLYGRSPHAIHAHDARATRYWRLGLTKWSPEELKSHISFMQDLNRDLTKSGELVRAEGLAPPSDAKVVRHARNGTPAITDGPFPETKEFLAGFWIVEVDAPERAYEIAAKASAAPGPGGAPLVIPIEVRQVMSAPSTNA
jgi:hypothetical protein